MSDSSPTIRRKPRHKAPVIRTSQDSPVQFQSKRAVPPSPGSAVSHHAAAANTAAPSPGPPVSQHPSPGSAVSQHAAAANTAAPCPGPPVSQHAAEARMSDSSPPVRRKPRHKAPVIRTSQDSPVQPQANRAVPPSPGPPVSKHAAAANTAAEAQAASEAQAIASSPGPLLVAPGSSFRGASFRTTSFERTNQGIARLQATIAAEQRLIDPVESHHVASPSLCRPPPKAISKRQQMLQNPLLDLQAKEGDSGDSVDGTQNSEDDAHLPNLSYVTDGSYSDGDRALYVASLFSQGEALGFGTPLHQTRRGVFQ